MDKEVLISQVTPILKSLGYKKRRNTWTKNNNEIIIVFNVQGSCYDKESYYLNLGVFLSRLSEKTNPSISDCQIQQRIDSDIDASSVEKIIALWEEWYGSIDKLRVKALEGKLPKASTVTAVTYLTMV